MDNLKDTAKKIFEEIQITKSIKEGFNGCTPQQRYERSAKGKATKKRYNQKYFSSEAGKQKRKEINKRYYERRKLLNSSFNSPVK